MRGITDNTKTEQTEWPSATIYVLNWNGRSLLESCLPPLTELDYPNYNVVLIDNNSSDDSVDYTQTTFPNIKIIQNEANIGFSKGMNVGLRQHTNDVAVLLNTDVEVRPEWLTELVRPMTEDATVGITGSKLYFGDGRTLQHAGATMQLPLGIGRHRFYYEEDTGQAEEQSVVDYVTGAAMAITKSVLEATGGFDEDFAPFYYEEVDLCWRTKAAGYKILYVPQSVAIHYESMTFRTFSRPYYHNLNRNRILFLLKHLPPEQFSDNFAEAEKEYMQTQTLAEEFQTLHQVYIELLLKLQAILSARGLENQRKAYQHVLLDLAHTAVLQTPTAYHPSQTPAQEQRKQQALLPTHPVTTTTPLIGGLLTQLRNFWGSIAAKWLTQEIRAQQIQFNVSLLRKLDEHAKKQQIVTQELTFLTTEINKLQHQLVEKKARLQMLTQHQRQRKKGSG